MKRLIHPRAVSLPPPYRWHRNLAEVALTEKLQALAAQRKANGGSLARLKHLLGRATFPTETSAGDAA